jgi:hypothetical protein
MMGELLDAIDNNRDILPSKELAFNIGVVTLALTLIGGSVFLRLSTVTASSHHSGSTPAAVTKKSGATFHRSVCWEWPEATRHPYPSTTL